MQLNVILQVARRTLQLGLGLGFTLTTVLALGRGRLPQLFTGDAAVLAAIGHIFPWVVLSQPINALAFVWDGILYGAGGFSYAAKVRLPQGPHHHLPNHHLLYPHDGAYSSASTMTETVSQVDDVGVKLSH